MFYYGYEGLQSLTSLHCEMYCGGVLNKNQCKLTAELKMFEISLCPNPAMSLLIHVHQLYLSDKFKVTRIRSSHLKVLKSTIIYANDNTGLRFAIMSLH